MSDGRFFTTTKKGEIYELKEELNSLDKGKKKDAVKKVIAAMTVGKDVSSLFPDVVNCMQTENLELKKLVYLYLINYAKSQPDLAIMAVNTFVKDSQDPNPLIRALAVRTMGCIRVEKITEYLCDPLTTCLMDDDPYVRKTAAICVAKLHDISPDIVEDRGFLDTLRDMLGDSNPMVVANAVAALAEIDSSSAKSKFKITSQTLYKLLAALNECTEWGQVFILDSLAKYDARDTRDAESIIERVTPRLQHANCAVVLSAVKVILKQMDILTNTEMTRTLCKKMAPPLVTILSSEPEIQYVALRNINLIIQKRPNILANDIKVFFCKYNDPIYVKMEKLEVMIKLASERNIDQVLLEFKEYATEVDVDFVRKAVRAIGRCAISLEKSVESCINVLTELIHTKVNYVVQEAICVIKDVFRKYPNTYEKIIATLCENLDTLDEPEAKASMIWIIGEYAERIDNADELLETFLETFLEENTAVQLQLLTATVKLFLKRPNENVQGMIQAVLHQATQETDNPDLRDRAYIYWRLLSTDPEAAKDVVLADKPTISDDANVLEDALLNELLVNIGTLASVYHKPAESFVSITRVEPSEELEEGNEEDEATDAGPSESAAAPVAQVTDLMGDLMGGDPQPAPTPAAPAVPTPAAPAADPLSDLLGLDMGAPAAPAPTPAAPAGAAADPFGMMGLDVAAAPAPPTQNILLQAAQAQGLEIKGIIAREGADLVYLLTFSNSGAMPLDGFQIQFNKNSFGLTPGAPLQLPAVAPGGSATTRLPLLTTGAVAPGPTSPQLQIAIKNRQHQQVWYFADSIPVEAMFLPDGRVDRDTFLKVFYPR
mmetsp:Transcript_43715/g.52861  ORF Transcript_43715/g.52861 Transcript_43715/m.52861 type:complete len:831 (-) Transcript_43715:12-2504(-)